MNSEKSEFQRKIEEVEEQRNSVVKDLEAITVKMEECEKQVKSLSEENEDMKNSQNDKI